MKILIIGAHGTIGKRITERLSGKHEVITAGRNSGDLRVDLTSKKSIQDLFEQVKGLDACLCTAASGAMDNFRSLTELDLLINMKGKLLGQVNTVLIGQHYLNDNGCFTLTSGIFADRPSKGVTGGGMISGALHSFVLSAAVELERGLRVNVVSPGMAEDSAADFSRFFPDLKPVGMGRIVDAYVETIEKDNTGEIIRVYE
ncbi:short chain dehydrogenase [Sinomicrobium weinanense]|uniref:Short chain dehydrogenase n=1 Tax=Sinomicrobium weinanense TaxID=2842200 RepID=A0A926JU70_9FLAO|nr:short chain dehydrogenase [Sinomicrobium weinanense]MBC9797555.1 short chain dehydrogenase [Sinomicrobium weinanense]MBU3123910.1 short chain dehydrogenase [Sinomicrobium weinanense]